MWIHWVAPFLFAIFFFVEELKHRKNESKESLGFCKSIYWKNVGQVASLLNMLNVSHNYFLKELGLEFCPSVPALIKSDQLWIKMADWTNDFLLLSLQNPSKWQKKYKNKSISVEASPWDPKWVLSEEISRSFSTWTARPENTIKYGHPPL